MKVALIGPTYPFRGGIAHYTTLLYQALCQQHEVCFVSFSRQYPAWLFPGKSDRDPSDRPMTADGAEFLLDSMNPWTWYRSARRILEFEPELVIFQWWVAFWAPHFGMIRRYLQRHSSAKIVFLCHNAVEHESNPMKLMATRWVLSRADRIFTHADPESRRLQELLGPQASIQTAFHPTYAALGEREISRQDAREQLQLDGKVLLFFGFVRPYKGLDVLLKALPGVLARTPVCLMVVGEHWQGGELYREMIRELELGDQVRLVDRYVPNEEIGLWFAAADLVVQPYRSASGSGICQLAYGHKRPVVATRVGSLSEVVKDGENGRLVASEDSDALADAIVESLKPETLDRLTAGAAVTGKRFSWERLVEILVHSGTDQRDARG